MNSASFATNLLGARVRLAERPTDAADDAGSVVLVYLDAAHELHLIVLIHGRLVDAKASQVHVLQM